MKRILPFIALASFTVFSCSKEYSVEFVPTSLNGTWRMITVKDHVSGLTISKPSDLQGEVVITFIPKNNTSGIFYGRTLTNQISECNYTTGANGLLSIPSLFMTKLAETSWGQEFVNNICTSIEYSFESNGNLVIRTTNRMLIFERL